MKKLFSVLVAIMMPMVIQAQEVMKVEFKDGTISEFQVKNIYKVYFSGEDITPDVYVNPDSMKYVTVFTNRFGNPSPTHHWGFELNSLNGNSSQNHDNEEYDYRVMAEDLSTNENSDFDFNDVVFDVKYVSPTVAKVKVRAAGGIFPIRIDQNDDYEIHALLGGAVTMLNTFAGHHNDLEADEIEVSGNFGSSSADAQFKLGIKNIKVEVNKGGGWSELFAPIGTAASKIAVPVSVDWCNEYQDIDEKWGTGAFAAWVQDENQYFWE